MAFNGLTHGRGNSFWLCLLLQRRNAPVQFVYDIVEMTDCILEAVNSSIQAYITALTGRLGPSISHYRFRVSCDLIGSSVCAPCVDVLPSFYPSMLGA